MLSKPLVIGISGGSGSGKTALADALRDALLPRVSVCLSQDRYYRSLAGDPACHNFDHPDSLDWKLFAAQLEQLRRGQAVEVPDYCFVSHRRIGSRPMSPAEILILEGTLILSRPEIANQLDLAVYIDIEPDIRVLRRLLRDLKERGRTADSVVEQYLGSVRPMHAQFVAPSRERAHMVLGEGSVDEWTRLVLDWIKRHHR
jgi:uridine kinase